MKFAINTLHLGRYHCSSFSVYHLPIFGRVFSQIALCVFDDQMNLGLDYYIFGTVFSFIVQPSEDTNNVTVS